MNNVIPLQLCNLGKELSQTVTSNRSKLHRTLNKPSKDLQFTGIVKLHWDSNENIQPINTSK